MGSVKKLRSDSNKDWRKEEKERRRGVGIRDPAEKQESKLGRGGSSGMGSWRAMGWKK